MTQPGINTLSIPVGIQLNVTISLVSFTKHIKHIICDSNRWKGLQRSPWVWQVFAMHTSSNFLKRSNWQIKRSYIGYVHTCIYVNVICLRNNDMTSEKTFVTFRNSWDNIPWCVFKKSWHLFQWFLGRDSSATAKKKDLHLSQAFRWTMGNDRDVSCSRVMTSCNALNKSEEPICSTKSLIKQIIIPA